MREPSLRDPEFWARFWAENPGLLKRLKAVAACRKRSLQRVFDEVLDRGISKLLERRCPRKGARRG